jgi:hypothetical protein
VVWDDVAASIPDLRDRSQSSCAADISAQRCSCAVLLQVLRIVVEATGMARRLCAPREVIVERVFKRCGGTSGGH